MEQSKSPRPKLPKSRHHKHKMLLQEFTTLRLRIAEYKTMLQNMQSHYNKWFSELPATFAEAQNKVAAKADRLNQGIATLKAKTQLRLSGFRSKAKD